MKFIKYLNLCVINLMILSVAQTLQNKIVWLIKNEFWRGVEGSGNSLIWYNIPVFPWRDWGNHEKFVMVVDVLSEIWTKHCLNRSEEP
jgi:hypothetical protein